MLKSQIDPTSYVYPDSTSVQTSQCSDNQERHTLFQGSTALALAMLSSGGQHRSLLVFSNKLVFAP